MAAPTTSMNLAYNPSHPDTRSSAPVSGALYGNTLVNQIIQTANKYGVDPKAALAVAPHEGGFEGAVGDEGTSFGPFQLHAGGALPAQVWAQGPAYAKQWANSPDGINYAMRGISSAVGSQKGPGAAAAIVANFERPAAQYEPGEARAAEATYTGGSVPVPVPIGSSGYPQAGAQQIAGSAPSQTQQLAARKVSVLGSALSGELLSSAQQLLGGGTPNLKNLFTLASGFQTARKTMARPAPLGGTALARAAGKLKT